MFTYIICKNEKKLAYSFKLSDDTTSNLGQDLEGKSQLFVFKYLFVDTIDTVV